MKLQSTTANLLLLHLIVLIFGFTGILGKLITVDSEPLVWWRMLIALVAIAIFMKLARIPVAASPRTIVTLVLTGAITAAHWIAFFEAIKVSTVSVTLACLSTAALFTALIEPIFFKRRISGAELTMGVIIVFGLILIFSFETQYATGIILALIAALLAACFTVLNGLFIRVEKPSRIALYEMIGGVIAITIYLIIRGKWSTDMFRMQSSDWMWLMILGIVCTAFAFVASVKVMKTITPFSVSLSINLEPVYGILLAWLIFGEEEQMTWGFYSGAFVILATVFTNAVIQRRKRKLLK